MMLIPAIERILNVHTIDTVVDYLIEHEVARRADLVPCSTDEVAEIRTKQGSIGCQRNTNASSG